MNKIFSTYGINNNGKVSSFIKKIIIDGSSITFKNKAEYYDFMKEYISNDILFYDFICRDNNIIINDSLNLHDSKTKDDKQCLRKLIVDGIELTFNNYLDYYNFLKIYFDDPSILYDIIHQDNKNNNKVRKLG